jgi:hypothetical protein
VALIVLRHPVRAPGLDRFHQPRTNIGYTVIAVFLATWLLALAIWRFGRTERRWTHHYPPQPKRQKVSPSPARHFSRSSGQLRAVCLAGTPQDRFTAEQARTKPVAVAHKALPTRAARAARRSTPSTPSERAWWSAGSASPKGMPPLVGKPCVTPDPLRSCSARYTAEKAKGQTAALTARRAWAAREMGGLGEHRQQSNPTLDPPMTLGSQPFDSHHDSPSSPCWGVTARP